MKVLDKKLFRDLWGFRAQVVTLATLVICGVAVLVASWSAYKSLQKAQVRYYAQNRFADVFAEVVRAPSDILERVRKIPGVELAEGRVVVEVLLDIPQQVEPALGRFISYDPHSLLNLIHLKKGRFPEGGSSNEVVVHESFAKAHKMRPGDHFKALFKGKVTRLVVAGIGISPEYVYALSPIAPLPDDRHFGVIWMNHDVLSRLNQMEGAFNSFVIRKEAGASLDSVKAAMDRILKPFGSLGSYDRSRQISNMFVEDEIRQQRSMSAVVPGIFIGIATFIMHIVMVRLVSLHRGQIATLKSVGYSSFSLAIYYWRLVSLILVMGLLPSFALAYGIGQWYAGLYAEYFRFPQIDFSLSLQAILLGLGAGFLPGWMASLTALLMVFRLAPAEAMRPLSPPKFHKSIFEKRRMIRIQSIQTKMIMRSLFFRPVRTFFGIMGVAAATAVLINGSFWMDIINYMIQRQFHDMSRYDIEVRFVHPRRLDVISELKRIPGIAMIEGTRSVPVRLHFRNISKETALISVGTESSLRRILDRKGQTLQALSGRVLLSQYFQKKYNMKTGDELSFEVIDGRLPTFKAAIGGFVDDVLGSTVYVDKEDLHGWLSEAPSIDSVFLTVYPEDAQRVYIKLKEMPEVAAVSVKKLLIESFTVNLAGMIFTFTLILIAFAITISAAVLVNLARINLSEKSWEMASLEIMGFRIGEVFRLLFLELGIQVLLALIPGLILGYGLSYLSVKWIHTDTFSFPLIVEVKTYALATGVITLTFLASGWFLYRKVRKLNFSEALKARE